MLPNTYWGARCTSDSMDCALPIAIDARNGCSYNCLYCFSNSLMRDKSRNIKKDLQLEKFGVSQTGFNINSFEKLIKGKLNNCWSRVLYPLIKKKCPLQIGALGEPFDELEPKHKFTLKAIELCGKYKIPIRISTKGAKTIMRSEYLKALEEAKDYVWVAFSMITSNDKISKEIDVGAPTSSQRFEAMKTLSEIGIKTSLRYRPIIPKLATKETNNVPDYQILIDKAVESGAKAISYEIIFLNHMANFKQRFLYKRLSKAIGIQNFPSYWKNLSIKNQTCLRANRFYKYKLMMNIRNYAKNNNLIIGISDPHFKEYGDYACCCGIPNDDPIFGNYSTSMTDIVIKGRKHYELTGENLQFTYTDWAPEWAKHIGWNNMCNTGDAIKKRISKDITWYDNMRASWNNPRHPRSPYNYFEGILYPIKVDKNKNVIYEYRHWAAQIWKKKLPKLDVTIA